MVKICNFQFKIFEGVANLMKRLFLLATELTRLGFYVMAAISDTYGFFSFDLRVI